MRHLLAFAALVGIAVAQPTPESGKRYPRLVVRNAMVIDGNGTPASGPRDIVIEGGRIAAVAPPDAVARGTQTVRGDAEIDARGRYVLPGLINLHGHIQ